MDILFTKNSAGKNRRVKEVQLLLPGATVHLRKRKEGGRERKEGRNKTQRKREQDCRETERRKRKG